VLAGLVAVSSFDLQDDVRQRRRHLSQHSYKDEQEFYNNGDQVVQAVPRFPRDFRDHAETAYPFTANNADSEPNSISSSTTCSGYPATWTGQYDEFRDTLAAARSGGAIGVFYWEPTWTAIAGNGWDPTNPNSGDQWDNQTLFNWSGVANPAIALFKP
jgi:arabinogalactan endo-1,4-beta-galactosidase